MYQPFIVFIWGALLLPHRLDGHSVSLANLSGSTSGTNQSPTVSTDAPGPTLLSSKSFWSHFPQKGVSCKDLMPEALENFAAVPQLSQIFIQTALALALQVGGCTQHADILVLRLYRELGKADANALLSVMARSLGTAKKSGWSKSTAALQFNLDQLAYTQARRCKGLMRIEGSVLHGQVHSVHRGFLAAAAACDQKRNSCAGVASNGTGFYQVVERDGSYFLQHYGARSWLHQCQKSARNRRSAPENCHSEREKKVHAIVEWIPGVSTYYNFGTSIYYATQNCNYLAKERALEGAMDLGYDLLAALTGGTSSIARLGISAALKPVVKIGVRTSVNYLYPEKELDPIPTNYSGPKNSIPYRWIKPEGLIFNYKEKKETIDSVAKAKTFLEQHQPTVKGKGKAEDNNVTEEKNEHRSGSSDSSSGSPSEEGSKSEKGAAAPKLLKVRLTYDKSKHRGKRYD